METFLIVLEFVLIAVLQCLGIGFSVMQKISNLGDKYPEKTRNEIIDIYKKEDWDTVRISILVLILHLVVHLIVEIYAPSLRTGINYYMLWDFGLALFGGYAGQRVIYKLFGTAEKVLNKKVDNIQ